MINDVNNFPLRERGSLTKARPQQFYVCMFNRDSIVYTHLFPSTSVCGVTKDILRQECCQQKQLSVQWWTKGNFRKI